MNEPLPVFFYSLTQVLGGILPFPVHSMQEVLRSVFVDNGVSLETLQLGKICVLLAILFRFRHDILSQIVSVIRIAAERRRPETVDETIPLLYFCTLVPVIVVGFFLRSDEVLQQLSDHGWIMHLLGVIAGLVVIWVETRMNHSKTFVYWSVLEASLVGTICIFSNLPFLTFMTAAFMIGRFRGFRLEALLKFALICSLPLQIAYVFAEWNGTRAIIDGSTPIAMAVTALTSIGATWLFLSILTGNRPPLRLTKLGVLNVLVSGGALFLWFRAHSGS